MRAHVPFEGTTTTRDAFQGWKLPPTLPGIGLEIVGDRMHTLIPRGANLPASGSHVFSTAEDGQRELCVLIYAGDNPKASENELIGQFDLSGLPNVPKQKLQIEVC
jgi:molecular chaperone DnaK (HSP70)